MKELPKTTQELYDYFDFAQTYCELDMSKQFLKEKFFEAISLGILIEHCRVFGRIDYKKNPNFIC